MLPPGSLTLRALTGRARGGPTGPATAALYSVAARAGAIARGLGVCYIAAQVGIWHSYYAASPWRLAGPAAASVWGAAAVAYLWRRPPPWWLACADSGIYVMLALFAGWSVPVAVRGSAVTWLFLAITGEMFVPAWFTPVAVFIPLVLAEGAAYRVGAAVNGPPTYGGDRPQVVIVFLGVVATLQWCARTMLSRRARSLDAGLAEADRQARERYVILSRNLERREHERMLHDTVLNTLTALARGATGDAVTGRCRFDVALMESTLGTAGGRGKAVLRPYGTLLAGIEAVAAEIGTRGLAVHVTVTGDAGAAGDDRPPGHGRRPDVPVPVAAAMAYAVREALANVASHAGSGEAWVEVQWAAPRTAAADGVEVTVRDKGVGFDPSRVAPSRLGLRRSITERVADCGGRAEITSAPGEGTEVRLSWPAAAADAVPGGGGRLPGPGEVP
jgi:signal transduction histidine kinase